MLYAKMEKRYMLKKIMKSGLWPSPSSLHFHSALEMDILLAL
nr:13686_t:CDS:2 [Entrophospora candida]